MWNGTTATSIDRRLLDEWSRTPDQRLPIMVTLSRPPTAFDELPLLLQRAERSRGFSHAVRVEASADEILFLVGHPFVLEVALDNWADLSRLKAQR